MRGPLLAVVLLAAAGCDLGRDAAELDAAPVTDGFPQPDGDLVPAVGGPATLDVACWNLEWFPKDTRTIALAADLVTSLELDLVIVEEVASIAAWDELVARLPLHEGALSTHRYSPTEYQKIGFLYRADLLAAGPSELLFAGDTFDFPRPPMKMHFDVLDAAGAPTAFGFDAIGLHLKAGTAPEDAERRAAAMVTLEAYVRGQVAAGVEDELIVLGDYNEVLTDAEGRAVLGPMLSRPDLYRFRSAEAAAAGEASFIPSGKLIDHIVTTAGLAAEIGDARAVIPPLDAQMSRYDAYVSDHLPVVLSIPNP